MKLTYEQSLENFKEAFAKSGEVSNIAADVIPGAFSRRSFNYGPHAVYVERGDGQYIYTVDGKKLLDLSNNFSVNVLGANHPAITKAITDVIQDGFSFGNPTDSEYRLAKMICERIVSIDKVKFFCSSSEACIGALRIARGYTGKTKLAKFEGGYHGFGDEFSISAHPDKNADTGSIEAIKPQVESGGIPQSKVDNVILLTQNNFEVCEKILRANADEVACVFMELQACAGGMVLLEKDFVAQMRALTKELNIVLVFDETVSIRAAKGGLQSLYGILPDLTVSGKTLGGGLPIGIVGGSNEVMSIVINDTVQISGTHHGHLLACEAGIACLTTLDDAAYEYLNRLGERVKNELNAWAKENKYPFHIFGEASVLGYIFTNELGQTINTHRDYWTNTDAEKMQTYALEIATRGYYPVSRGQIGLTLPMTDEDIDGFIATTKDIVASICE